MIKTTIITFVILVCLVAVGGYLLSFKNKPATISWRTAPVEEGDIATSVTATGSLSALTTVQVGRQLSGTIAKLLAD